MVTSIQVMESQVCCPHITLPRKFMFAWIHSVHKEQNEIYSIVDNDICQDSFRTQRMYDIMDNNNSVLYKHGNVCRL